MQKMRGLVFIGVLLVSAGLSAGPVIADESLPRRCDGSLISERWCDRGDGTVKDMTTGLVWSRQADCWDRLRWYEILAKPFKRIRDGACGLTDGSAWGDWRAPTRKEMAALTSGQDAIRYKSPGPFTGLRSGYYWTVTTNADNRDYAWSVNMLSGKVINSPKHSMYYLWPVRSDR